MNRIRTLLAPTLLLIVSLAFGEASVRPPSFDGSATGEKAEAGKRVRQRFPDKERRELNRGEIHEEGHAGEMFDWWYGQRAFPNDAIPDAGYGNALAYTKASMPAESADSGLRGTAWTSIGPDNIGGRVLSIAVDPANTSRVWAGMAAGGLWLSTTSGDGADAWDLIDTGFPSVSVSGIVIQASNSNNMWISTGEIGRYGRGQVGTPGARSSYGLGVLRSTDGGATWATTGLNWTFDLNRAVQSLKIDPTNANVLWAATTEGVYKTMDAGTNWTLSNPVVMAMDVVLDPASSNIVYASHGQLGVPDDTQAGIYKTTNGGTNWVRLAGGLPTTNFGRTPLSVYKPGGGGSTVVYAGVSDAVSRQIVGLYRTTNGGTNWTNINSTNWASSQAWYDNTIAAHPTNSTILLCAGLDVYRSTNSGSSLSQVASWFLGFDGVVPPGGPEGPSDYVHADSHAITFTPGNPATVYVGCDGGVFKSTDTGATWAGKNGGLVTTQFYAGFANGFTTTGLALGGLQDNGTVKYLGTPSWSKVFGGDGGWCAIAANDEDVLYEEYVYSEIYKSTDGGVNWDNIHFASSSTANFIAPFVNAEINPNVLYCGTLGVEKSTNGGTSWTFTGGLTNWNGTQVNTIGVAFTDANYVIASTGSSATGATFELRRSTNGGANWTNVTAGLPNRYLTDISYDPANKNFVWITFSGYGASHVFRSTNAGLNWTDLTANLPDVPCQTVAVDPTSSSIAYVGTDLGIFRTVNGGSTWSDFNSGLPPAMILDLVFKKDERLLRAATFGNGVYERAITDDAVAAPVAIAPPTSSLLSLSNAAPNPFRSGTSFSLTLARDARVTATIVDLAGRRVRSLADGEMPAGATRLAWDGRDDAGRSAAPGAYFMRVTANGETSSTKLTLLR